MQVSLSPQKYADYQHSMKFTHLGAYFFVLEVPSNADLINVF